MYKVCVWVDLFPEILITDFAAVIFPLAINFAPNGLLENAASATAAAASEKMNRCREERWENAHSEIKTSNDRGRSGREH